MRYSHTVPDLLANRYELQSKVADGPVAAIWRGVQHGEAGFVRPVAVRVLREPWDRDRAILGAWAASASDLAERGSPQIEQVLDVLVEAGRALVVSEWIGGISLRRWLAARARDGAPVPWQLATAIGVEVLRALVSAHACTPPLCHEGIGPGCVRLARSGAVKVTRFGVAAALAVRGAGRRELEELSLLVPAPELLGGGSVTPSADVFGVGALLFEMLAGEPPFGAEPGDARDAAVRAGELPDLASSRADVPPILVAQIERALAPSPEARFPSAEAMLDALVRILQSEVEATGPEAIAAEVSAVLDRPKPSARPQGLADQRTMHVDLAELTILPSASIEREPSESPRGEENGEPARPQRYRFGYKERRAALAARGEPKLAREESETAPLPLTRKSDGARLAAERPEAGERPGGGAPKGLAPQRTEFLDEEQLRRLTIPDDEK